jgi:hypothetical protein
MHKIEIFVNNFPKSKFGLNRDMITKGWRKLHNEYIHDTHRRNAYNTLVGKHEEKRTFERPSVNGRIILY